VRNTVTVTDPPFSGTLYAELVNCTMLVVAATPPYEPQEQKLLFDAIVM
jgi:hypothetical protein